MLLGVDSAARITDLLPHVVALLGRKPDAWGRPVDGPYAIDAAEIALAKAEGIRLWLWGGGTTQALVAGDVLAGLQYGNRIAGLASRLGYRAGRVLGPDLEASSGWYPTGEWLAGALIQPEGWGYAPTVYFSAAHGPSVQAVEKAAVLMRYLGHPQIDGWLASWLRAGAVDPKRPPAWAPPSVAGVRVLGWQWAGNVPLPGLPADMAVDLDLWDEAAPMWTP